MNNQGTDDYLRSGQAAHILGVSEKWVHTLRKAGKLRAISTPLGYLFSKEDVERLAKEREKKAKSSD